ncbi:MAG: carboxypeptidase-like regulatory domain-containing protein [Bacteroidetes bacterium]|nr:carboxypeptidase-like regulatory domain-containing protein [Bacteroidota bacterium]
MLCTQVAAQSIIKGRVLDHTTKKPLANVNVFLSNSTVGDQTSGEGTFMLTGIKAGSYNLIVSMIGYDMYSQSITLNDQAVELPDIEISPKINGLKEVVIRAHDDPYHDWYLEMFKKEFLGSSALAAHCKIVNPSVLDFDYDQKTRQLKASSYDFIIIENEALGYRVKYLLTEFERNAVSQGTTVKYDGQVLFEKMQGTDAQQRRWQEKRREIYEGSEMHFLRSLLSDQLDENGFQVLQYAIYQNPDRPSDSLIKAKINYYTKLKETKQDKEKWRDSLSAWKKRADLPKIFKKLMPYPLERNEIMLKTSLTGVFALGCDFDGLYIDYNKNHHYTASLSYLYNNYNNECTLVNFSSPYTFFDSNGWVLNPTSRSFAGAWGKYRVSGMLPADYDPAVSTPQLGTKSMLSNDTSFHAGIHKNLVDSISQKISSYGKSHFAPTLFAHFDKTIYAQNENVWFTAYLSNRKNGDNPDVLSAVLVDDLDRSVVLERKFLMANGIASGNVYLTDSIPPGNYSFILYPNRVLKDKPEAVFVQHITILSATEGLFKVSLSSDTTMAGHHSPKILLKVTARDGRPLPGAAVAYKIKQGESKNVSGHVKTDNEGKYVFDIPRNQNDSKPAVLETKVTYDKEVRSVSLPVPSGQQQKISVKFYPEGGYLVHATAGWVGWEAKTGSGAPVEIHGVLFKDNVPVDTIETDSYGMGRFKLIPLTGSHYTMRLLTDKFRDSVFKLPQILLKSPAIAVANAVANDTLKLRLTSKYPEVVTVLVHNFRQLFFTFAVHVNAAGKAVWVDLKNMPKGLGTITVLDSAGRPSAERMFFAHYNVRPAIAIQTDKQQYTKREKVKLSLRFLTPDTGMVSVACVQSNRLTIKNNNDIESYVYLKHEMDDLPLKDNYLGSAETDKSYLENLLLIRGWRRYSWQGMMQTTPIDTNNHQSPLVFSGAVRYDDRPLKKDVRVLVMADSLTTTIKTDGMGNFALANDNIVTDENKKIHFLVVAKNPDDYKLIINDPYNSIDQKLAAGLKTSSLSPENDNYSLALKGMDHAIILKEVTINATKDNSIHTSSDILPPMENECGDYICMYGIFDCPNHKNWPGNHAPEIGKYYIIHGQYTKYLGCVLTIDKAKKRVYDSMPGIKYTKEFYGSDYSVINPSQPEYYSTIFWKHLVKVGTSKDVSFNFYTSDITGPFKVIVQGVTGNDVVYGEKEFDIK